MATQSGGLPGVIQFNRCSARRPPSEDRDLLLRTRLLESANGQRGFGYPRLLELLRWDELVQNHKQTERISRKKPSLRTRKRVKPPNQARIVLLALLARISNGRWFL